MTSVPDRFRTALPLVAAAATLGLWSSAFGAAFVAVIYAKLFRQAEILFASITADFSYFPFLISPVAFMIAWWLVYRYAPAAAGSSSSMRRTTRSRAGPSGTR